MNRMAKFSKRFHHLVNMHPFGTIPSRTVMVKNAQFLCQFHFHSLKLSDTLIVVFAVLMPR